MALLILFLLLQNKPLGSEKLGNTHHNHNHAYNAIFDTSEEEIIHLSLKVAYPSRHHASRYGYQYDRSYTHPIIMR